MGVEMVLDHLILHQLRGLGHHPQSIHQGPWVVEAGLKQMLPLLAHQPLYWRQLRNSLRH